MDNLKRKQTESVQTNTPNDISPKHGQSIEKRLKSNNLDPITDISEILKGLEYKNDIDSLNAQLKQKIEKLTKVSLEMLIIETRMKNCMNNMTLDELKSISLSLSTENKIHIVSIKDKDNTTENQNQMNTAADTTNNTQIKE